MGNEKYYTFSVKKEKKALSKGFILKVPANTELNSIRDEFGHMFGGAGVYLFLTESCPESEGRSKIYAGKARHLDSRANDKKRLEDKDFLFLIKKGKPNDDVSMNMDENWRQHVEHSLIKDLMSNQAKIGFECSNRSYESKSLAEDTSHMEMWYRIMKKKLIDEFQLLQFGKNPMPAKKRKPKLHLYLEGRVLPDSPIEFYGKDLIKVPEGTRCRTSQKAGLTLDEKKIKFSVDIPYQEYKKELIENEILVWKDELECWAFDEDQWFTSLSQMAAIVNNTQKGSHIWEAKYPDEDETQYVSLSKHPEWEK